MSSDESDDSVSQAKASSYDPFEATRRTPSKEKAELTDNATLLNLMSSYKDQHDSESSPEKNGRKPSRKKERSDNSEDSSSPARKSRKTSVKRSRSTTRHSRRRSKRRRSPSHRHRRRSRSRRRHKRRSSRSKFRYRDSSSSSTDSREHRRSHGSPKRHSTRRRSSSRRYHHRSSHHTYYRPHQERRDSVAHRLQPSAADKPEPKLPAAQATQPEPIHHYYVPHMGSQPSYGQPSSNPVAPRHKPRANLIEIIPTQANLSTLTEVNAKQREEPPLRPTVSIGHSKDLSDYLVEEMLLEEEVKQREQRRIAEEREAERLLICSCEAILDEMIEVLSVADYLCDEANWQRSAIVEEEQPSVKQRPPVVSWLCQVNVEELNNRAAAEREPIEEDVARPTTPAWPDTSNLESGFDDQAAGDDDGGAAESGRQIVDQWLEKDGKTTNAQSTNGIDELMQRIFKGRNTDERIVSWISGDEVCPAAGSEPEEHSSGGDEPYDPEVEEARMTNRDDTVVTQKYNEAEVSEHIEPLTIEELPSSATELYRIQKYRQKKQRMEQVIALAKECIKPRYVRREIDKEQYKMVMKKTVDKYMQSGRPANKEKISQLINYYIAADDQLT